MKIVRLQENFFEKSDEFRVEESKINAFQGYLQITEREKSFVVSRARKLWKKVFKKSGMDHFEGLIRFDFVPEFEEEPEIKDSVIDLGDLSIKGLYEINTHSPEGVACDALYRKSFPKLKGYTPNASKKLAEHLSEAYGGEITMVQGQNSAKDSWGNVFIESLNSYGVKVQAKTPSEIKKGKPSLLWRWGDVDFKKEFNEYEDEFQRWLVKQEKMKIINTIPESRKKDVANKKLIARKDDFILNGSGSLKKALELPKNDYVLKPLRGASGKGIVFGELEDFLSWSKAIKKAHKRGDYGLFKKMMLPKVEVNGLSITMDFLPAFYAHGNNLDYLYSLVRLEPWESYFSRKTINVAQGGGYGGTVKVVKGG